MILVRLFGLIAINVCSLYLFIPLQLAADVKWIAVAHAVSAGTDLPRALRTQAKLAGVDVKLLHLKLGNFDSDLAATFRPQDFDAQIEFPAGTSVESVFEKVRPYDLQFPIVVASEGPDWPFYINERLGLPTLAGDKARMLLNKNLFYAYLRDNEFGIAKEALDFAELRSSAQALQLVEQGRISFPVAVKPSNSAAGHGFKIVHNSEELVAHVRLLLETGWLLLDGRGIDTVVVQPSFLGRHYSLQVTAVNGNFVVSDIFEHLKDGSVYLQSELQNPDAAFTKKLFESQVPFLRSLGGTYSVHLEVVDDPRFGFVPYDCGPRPMGGKEHRLVKRVLGFNQQDRLAMAIIRPSDFLDLANALQSTGALYPSSPFAALVDWRQMFAGIAASAPNSELIKSLGGYIDHDSNVVEGSVLEVTDSLVNSPGSVWFSENEHVVRSSIASLRKFEADGLIIPLDSETRRTCGEQF